MRNADEKVLIANADDFGQSRGVNCGVIEAIERGLVTSVSLMVRWPAAGEAAAYSARRPDISVGLHVDLGEWRCREGTWSPLYTVVPLDDEQAVARQVAAQLAAFQRLLGRQPTHLDSHQHVHLREPIRSVLLAWADELKIPLRSCHGEIRYCGAFYGQTGEGQPLPRNVTVAGLLEILTALAPGITELGCHPGRGQDLDTAYGREREVEVETLCDARVRAILGQLGIRLASFHDISPPA
jgi:chitin disaccharide deacetylase